MEVFLLLVLGYCLIEYALILNTALTNQIHSDKLIITIFPSVS